MPARPHEPDPILARVMLADLAVAPQALANLQENDRENALLAALPEALTTRVNPPRAQS